MCSTHAALSLRKRICRSPRREQSMKRARNVQLPQLLRKPNPTAPHFRSFWTGLALHRRMYATLPRKQESNTPSICVIRKSPFPPITVKSSGFAVSSMSSGNIGAAAIRFTPQRNCDGSGKSGNRMSAVFPSLGSRNNCCRLSLTTTSTRS